MNTVRTLDQNIAMLGYTPAIFLAMRPYLALDGNRWTSTNGRYTWGSSDSPPVDFSTGVIGGKGKLSLNYPSLLFDFMNSNVQTERLLDDAPGLTVVMAMTTWGDDGSVLQIGADGNDPMLNISRTAVQAKYNMYSGTLGTMNYSTTPIPNNSITVISIDVPNQTCNARVNKSSYGTATSFGSSGYTAFGTQAYQSRLGPLNWTATAEYNAMAFIHKAFDSDGMDFIADQFNKFFNGKFF